MPADVPTPIRLDRLERTSDNHDLRLQVVEARVDATESRLDVIGTKLGIYAALGALFGSAVATGVAAALFH